MYRLPSTLGWWPKLEIFHLVGGPRLGERSGRGLRQNGFAVVDFPLANIDEAADGIIERLSGKFDDLSKAHNGARVQDAWQFDDAVKEIALNAAIINLLSHLFGRKAFPFQTLNFPIGTQQHFHSDSVHFSSVPERFMCGVWVALEDVDEDNGPLLYYPGTHTWPIYSTDQLGVNVHELGEEPGQGLYEPLWRDLVEAAGITPQEFHPRKGQALIWAANLLHGGAPVIDRSRTRWSQVTHYYFEDCAYTVPLASNTGMGHTQYKEPFNITTGRRQPNQFLGQPVIDPLAPADKRGNQPLTEDAFDAEAYLAANPDVAESKHSPYQHYLEDGFFEIRSWKKP